MKPVTIERTAAILALTALLLMPMLAGAEPFANATNSAKSYAMAILTPAVGLGVLIIGALCFTGRVAWGWLGAAFVGAGLIFGHEQIATMFQAWTA